LRGHRIQFSRTERDRSGSKPDQVWITCGSHGLSSRSCWGSGFNNRAHTLAVHRFEPPGGGPSRATLRPNFGRRFVRGERYLSGRSPVCQRVSLLLSIPFLVPSGFASLSRREAMSLRGPRFYASRVPCARKKYPTDPTRATHPKTGALRGHTHRCQADG
jgi:hypothetical protein